MWRGGKGQAGKQLDHACAWLPTEFKSSLVRRHWRSSWYWWCRLCWWWYRVLLRLSTRKAACIQHHLQSVLHFIKDELRNRWWEQSRGSTYSVDSERPSSQKFSCTLHKCTVWYWDATVRASCNRVVSRSPCRILAICIGRVFLPHEIADDLWKRKR